MVTFKTFKGSKDGKIVESTSSREIKPDEVLILITHSGVCGTDEHFRQADMVLGHEGVGIVEQLGSAVTTFKVRDRVGWGYVHSSCGQCRQCLTGHENVCPTNQTYEITNRDQGSFGTHAVWQAAYIFKVPSSIASEHAAPLMCGGATVFHALRSSGVPHSDRVGVIGVGGPCHLAIQFASKMGCDVVVFSGTDSKKDEAKSLGANQFVVTKNRDTLDIGKPIDHLIVTTSMPPDWNKFIPLMSPMGAIYPLTVSGDDLKLPFDPILHREVRILGSRVSPRQHHREMLEFAALHGIRPVVETFPLTREGITSAMDRLAEGR